MDDDIYILTHKGRVQLHTRDGHTGMVVATSHKAARAFAKRCLPKKLSVAKVGTVQGETLDAQFAKAKEHGATGVWFTDGENMQFGTKE